METIKAKANNSKKTFTIRKYIDGKLFSKFRTMTMSKDEFEEMDMYSESDWKNYLRRDQSYRVVK